ncbi:MAG: DUF4202 domain-containing protein [Candidatus Nitrotoga sp.]|nr:DUF4202 domain-containing protein [Candidatus Nitrotoga sp.]MBP0117283.1 DUF4202 domain-containing protein [Candidatus Nitrotoga sp.]MBP0123011.1 DUF4202 domain-containing protein [Candidatus Nitrotoga sp.]MBP0125574.1 DUF4202 domain-containing protein [Candidatus Nitrotoga sp.]
MPIDLIRFERAISEFDAINAGDPNQEIFEGRTYAKELLYAERMTVMLHHFAPNASEMLQLAARCQHICRWKISRDSYVMGGVGYKSWRAALYKLHGEIAGEIMRKVGYDESAVAGVQMLLRKEEIKTNLEGQILVDVVSLVFVQSYLADFIDKYSNFDEEKLLNILRKTCKKMSIEGRATGLNLPLTSEIAALFRKALALV